MGTLIHLSDMGYISRIHILNIIVWKLHRRYISGILEVEDGVCTYTSTEIANKRNAYTTAMDELDRTLDEFRMR
ncbi:MAG: hypothetical protein V7629_08100 [Motiliproteus sp.]